MARETWEVRPGQSIAAAIAKARGGDTVLIIGRHTESFVIDKGITLKGKSDAEIRGSDSPIVRVRAHGVRIEGLTFHQSATDGPRGVGLVTIESGRAEVHRSKFSGGRSGLCVKGHAHADLVENTIERSGLYGVMYLEHASGEARKNRVRSNVNNGMGAVGDSSPRFVDNVVERNGRAGIVFFERARGEAIGNLCRYNGRHGIVVDADAAPSLQRNRTVDNVGPGIGFYAQSSGHASGNDIHGNGSGGLLIKQDARPDTHSNNEYNNRPDTGRF
jgi:nitrous oxidase accessory protein NosD